MLGKKTKGEPVIITMVERQNRFMLTKKVWSMNAEEIQKAVQQMMNNHGLASFKSITTEMDPSFLLFHLLKRK